MTRIVALMLLCALVPLARAEPLHVLRLSPKENHGVVPRTYRFPDGTVLTNTLVYDSKASGLSVGRSYVNGPLMPPETANYTDVFMVARGSATLIESSGIAHKLTRGDFVLLPRGLTFELRHADHYIHYFASFDRQKDARFRGPITLQILHPDRFCKRLPGGMRDEHHTYYAGRGGVVVSAYRYFDSSQAPGPTQMPYSELLFVVSGTGSVQEPGQARIPLAPGAAIFIPKDVAVSFDARELCTLSVQFDRNQDMRVNAAP